MNAPHVFVPFSTGVPIPSRMSAQITGCIKRTFRPTYFFIPQSSRPKDWIVEELRINGRLVWRESLPGSLFTVRDRWSPFVDTVIRRKDTVVLVVTYVGRLKKGLPFCSALVGYGSRQKRARRVQG